MPIACTATHSLSLVSSAPSFWSLLYCLNIHMHCRQKHSCARHFHFHFCTNILPFLFACFFFFLSFRLFKTVSSRSKRPIANIFTWTNIWTHLIWSTWASSKFIRFPIQYTIRNDSTCYTWPYVLCEERRGKN